MRSYIVYNNNAYTKKKKKRKINKQTRRYFLNYVCSSSIFFELMHGIFELHFMIFDDIITVK